MEVGPYKCVGGERCRKLEFRGGATSFGGLEGFCGLLYEEEVVWGGGGCSG